MSGGRVTAHSLGLTVGSRLWSDISETVTELGRRWKEACVHVCACVRGLSIDG